jgi:hypothetical protein
MGECSVWFLTSERNGCLEDMEDWADGSRFTREESAEFARKSQTELVEKSERLQVEGKVGASA